uniref:Protein piccolo n=1 Tax=Corvus moneduloides TaxID=1196302 RepID=A0A8C3DXY1_CORMO
MGNEASLEGGEGMGAFPEGAAAAGDGGGPAAPLQSLVPAGVEADLSQLSEEERRQIAAVMSRAQGLPRGNLAGAEPPPMQRHPELDSSRHPRQPGKPPDPGPPGLSKSRTVDVLKTEQRAPGRSPSSLSLRESKSRTDFKEDQKPSMMPSFLSEANPLSAVTSVVNKFNPFDLISDSDTTHEDAGRKQKVTPKEQGKPEEQRSPAKHPTQPQSPKPAVQQQGQQRPTLQQTESSKAVPQQQQQPGEPKQVQKPGHRQPADAKQEQLKQPPQPRGPQKSQPQPSEPAKPVQQQTSAKLSSGPTKPSPQQPDSAKTTSQAPPPTKPSSQQPGPAKQPLQQPARQGGPVKPSSQQAGPPKQPSQQPGPEKPSAQQTGPAKQPPQPGSGKPPLQQTGPVKQVPPQAGPMKPPSQTAGPTKPPVQQPGPTKPSGQQPGPEKPLEQKQAGASQPTESVPKKTFCPLCTTTELLLHTPEKANYNTCTQCHTVVCSLCGFNPNPHITEISEWLCLNCQMQRALGGDLAAGHGPGPQPPAPKQKTPIPPSTAKPSPQPQPVQKKDITSKPDPSQLADPKKPLPQKKQTPLPGSPPVKSKQPRAEPTEISQQTRDATPKSDQVKPTQAEDKQKQPSVQKPTADTVSTSAALEQKQDLAGPRPPTQQKVTDSPKPELAKPSQDTHPAGDKPDSKPVPQVSRQKSDPKLASQPGARPDAKAQKPVEPTQTKDDPKKLPTKPAPKPDTKAAPKGPQAGAGPKPGPAQPAPQPQPPQKTPEQSRRFSLNLGGITDAPKPQPTTPQETVTGKLFGFGASFFSQASNLISTAGQPGSQTSGAPPAAKQPQPPPQPPAPQTAPKETGQAQPPPKVVPVKKEAKPLTTEKSEPSKVDSVLTKGSDLEKKPGLAKDSKPQAAEAKKPDGLLEPDKASQPEMSCPLCKTGLNIGSKDPPNFNTCTECKKVVCNLCGFNPMPHIAEVQEWLCLNCQTQRAMSGQLGDMGKVPLPKTGPSQPTSKPPAPPQKQPMPAVSHSPQKTSTPPTLAAAKPKEEPGIQKEAPKLQQGRLEKTLSADKIQQGVQREDAKPKQGKLVKTPSADKIQRASQKEDPRIQQTRLTKTASYDRVLHEVQKEDEKLQEAKLAKTSSADKILHGVQKEDIKLQETKLAKIPSADKILQGIQKEDPKLQQMKMAKALSADKIQPAVQKEDAQLQEVKLPKAASVDKIQHGIQKEDIKLQHEKIKKTRSVDKIQEEDQKEETKLQRGKLSKTPSANKIPATTTADQKKPLSTVEEDKETVPPEKSTPHPEDKKEEITAEIKDHVAKQKAEVEAPYKGLQAKEQEDVKKEDLTTGISQEVLKTEKAQEEEIPVQTAPLPRTDHVEAVREKISKGSSSLTPSSTQKKVKRTLPNPPPEEAAAGTQSPYTSVGSVSRRRICRTTTMARAKILQDIDRELDLVERESAKLRKKQAELDEEEKEIDAKLRYLEMGINRRKEALLKEREKRERAYLQGVAEERDYMSDSEVNNTRSTRIETQHGLERPRTAPQTEFNQFMPPQTQPETQFAPATSPYAQYQYSSPALPTQAPTQFTQQSHYQQQQPLYHQQVSPYQTQSAFQTGATMSFTPQAQPPPSQQPSYQLPSQMMVIQPKPRQTTLYLEPKITTNYDVIRNQPLMIAPVSTDNSYAVSQLGSKYSTLDLRIGLDERNSIASSPISSISADSFYADIDPHHTPRNYVLIDDIGELTKGTGALGSSFSLHEKDLTKTDRLLRTTEARRAQEVSDFLAPLQTSSRLHSYVKADEDPMEDPYELKLLKHQIKQEFRRGAESLDHLAGLSQYYHGEGSYRHFPKSEKYSIGRLTLEKQAAKQLPAALLYQKQSKHKKALIDPKLTKFSPIQESRDLEPDYSSYMTSSTSTLGGITTRARLLQDDITYGLRKNISDQQKYMGPPLTSSIGAGLGTALGPTMRSTLQDEADKSYSSGSRSRPSSRPSSVYGLDLSLKRDSSSSSLRLKAQEAEPLDVSFSHAAPSGRTKPTSLPISQSRGRIPIVAQNSEEESPLSPVGQPMGMARAAAGPLPPISADTRDQFGSSHSLPEVQQHMREESRTRGYDRDIAFIMDDFQHAMSDSEAYHLRREETDWFDKPREPRLENGHILDRRLPEKLSHSRPLSQHQDQINGKPLQYIFPHTRLKLLRDPKDHTVSGNGLGIRVVGGKEIPGSSGEIGAYIAKILPGGNAEQTGKLIEGMQVLEWNGIPLTGKTYEEVQSIIIQQSGEAEICVRLDLNMLSDSENPQHLELHEPIRTVDKAKSPGVDPKQLAAELQKVSLQQSPLVASSGVEKGSHVHSGTTSATSSAVPSPGQPGSPSVSKKRHSSKPTETTKSASHPITGEIQLQINYDKHLGNLIIHILQARNLAPRDNNGYSDPFVKVYLLPGRGAEYKRRTKYIQKSLNPEWNQTVIYKNISMEQLKKKTLEVTVWDYDRFSSNDFLGEVLIELSSISQLDNTPRWYPLKEQSENIDHGKSHSGQSSQQSPKPSVIKSRSHGIFPDPSKDMQVPTIEKSHSSPGSSKSSSEGHLRSHGPSRSQSKTSVTQTHLEDAGAAIAAAEAAVQQLRLQPTAHKSGQSNHARKQHRHSIAGVLPIQRTQSDNLPPPANDNKDQSQLALRKVMSDGPVKPEGARSTNHRPAESSVSTGSSASSFGSGYSMDSEGSSSATGENNLFPIPRIGKMSQNGQEPVKQSGVGVTDSEGKTQVMGEIKIALKKEMKTDGEQLIVEILQCRNITYKFKSPDHLPDLYVKLYVVNISTQKRVIKKKTRVCRHDREPSFNETFRFSLSPAGHSLQILLVSNGGKFMKKTLIGEAYIWLDKVDLRKRIVNWHKLLVSSTQTH